MTTDDPDRDHVLSERHGCPECGGGEFQIAHRAGNAGDVIRCADEDCGARWTLVPRFFSCPFRPQVTSAAAELESLREQNAALSEALGEAEERTVAARGIDYFLDQIAGSLTAHAGQPAEVRDLATSLRRKAAALRGAR